MSRWERLTTPFLCYWRCRATALYLEDVADPKRKKDGTRSAGQMAAIENGTKTLRGIARELRRRGATCE